MGDPSTSFVSKEQRIKEEERDQNMAKVMTQLDLLTKHVIEAPSKAVKVISYKRVKAYDDEKLESFGEEI